MPAETRRPRLSALLLVAGLVAVTSLAGCGRKGRLEPPPGQDYIADSSGKQKDPGPVKPKRSLPLDFLLN